MKLNEIEALPTGRHVTKIFFLHFNVWFYVCFLPFIGILSQPRIKHYDLITECILGIISFAKCMKYKIELNKIHKE